MKLRLKRILAGGLALAVAVLISPVPRAPSALAANCQRAVAIQPEVSVGEGAGTLTFTVISTGCAAAGSVNYVVTAGTAQRPADFVLANGHLQWSTGDTGPRSITAVIVPDPLVEAAIEDFTVQLVAPSPGVLVAAGTGHGRILDDDSPGLIVVVDDSRCQQTTSPPVAMAGTDDVHQDELFCPPPSAALSEPPPATSTLRWSTVDGTAKAGIDFVGVRDQQVTVPTGATRVPLRVQYLPRPPGTASRSFFIQISAPATGTIVDPVASVTIVGP